MGYRSYDLPWNIRWHTIDQRRIVLNSKEPNYIEDIAGASYRHNSSSSRGKKIVLQSRSSFYLQNNRALTAMKSELKPQPRAIIIIFATAQNSRGTRAKLSSDSPEPTSRLPSRTPRLRIIAIGATCKIWILSNKRPFLRGYALRIECK